VHRVQPFFPSPRSHEAHPRVLVIARSLEACPTQRDVAPRVDIENAQAMIAACASPVQIEYDGAADFARYRTWSWPPSMQTPGVDLPVEASAPAQPCPARWGFARTVFT
jgi:hypothetical protein